MIERYSRPEMARLWEDKRRLELWLKVEILVLEALSLQGMVPKGTVLRIKRRVRLDPARIAALEERAKHDVVAFVSQLSEVIGEDSRYLHLGLTSSDLLDTSLAVTLRDAAGIIIKDILRLLSVLKDRAFKYKDTVMIGRTHGIHAEPITFGLKLALWYDEMRRNLRRMREAREVISYGKVSGAVGTFAHLSPEVEAYVMRRLKLKPALVSSQVIQRDRYAQYFTTLAIIASSIEKMALEIRHLQRSEVGEAEEFFSEGQKGSSAMPHKRNPITSERLCGLARVVRGNSLAALENVALWHERDISHSSVERVIAPDSTILVDYMLSEMTNLMDRLIVYPERMRENLERSRGLIFSQRIMLELMRKGLGREEAYDMVQGLAMKSFQTGGDFKQAVIKDKGIRRFLEREEIEGAFDLSYHLRYVDAIFQRVFGGS